MKLTIEKTRLPVHCATVAMAMALTVPLPAVAGNTETLVLQFLGSAPAKPWNELSQATVSEIQALDDAGDLDVASLDGFGCFEIGLLAPSSGANIGTGVDCLSPKPIAAVWRRYRHDTFDAIEVTAFSFFILPGGAFVSTGMTSVRGFIPDVGSAGRYTHVTGSIPDGDNIISGTGQFEKGGSTRVSGAVDMSEFGASGIIDFNCLWVAVVEMKDG
jgi:hypothetical protein